MVKIDEETRKCSQLIESIDKIIKEVLKKEKMKVSEDYGIHFKTITLYNKSEEGVLEIKVERSEQPVIEVYSKNYFELAYNIAEKWEKETGIEVVLREIYWVEK